MRIDISARGFELTNALKDHICRRVHFATDRFEEQIEWVRVHLDKNKIGYKPAKPHRCVMTAKLRKGGTIPLLFNGENAYMAIDQASGCLGERLAQRMSKLKDAHKRIRSREALLQPESAP